MKGNGVYVMQSITIRTYHDISDGELISGLEMREQTHSMLERHLANVAYASITRRLSQKTYVIRGVGDMSVCIETTMLLDCSSTWFQHMLRSHSSSFRKSLSSAENAVLRYAIWSIS